MRYHSPLEKTNMLGKEPKEGQLGPPGTRVINSGHPYRSEIFLRSARRGTRQMPPVGTTLTDPRALDVLHRWIGGL
jgi:hypothetical protein